MCSVYTNCCSLVSINISMKLFLRGVERCGITVIFFGFIQENSRFMIDTCMDPFLGSRE